MRKPSKNRLMNEAVYKICGNREWDRVRAGGAYAGSADDLRDGYIHLSTARQLAGTLEKHFAGRDDLLLVEVCPERLGERLKWEPSRGGALFPHLYGALEMSAVRDVQPVSLGRDGRHVLPPEIA